MWLREQDLSAETIEYELQQEQNPKDWKFVPELSPVSWAELVRRLHKLGFEGPLKGVKHPYTTKGDLVLTIPRWPRLLDWNAMGLLRPGAVGTRNDGAHRAPLPGP